MHIAPAPTLPTEPAQAAGTKPDAPIDPWALIDKARASLARGGPAQLRVLIARALGSLGLPEPAALWADSTPTTPELTPLIQQIRAALPALAPSTVSLETLTDRIERALEARPEIREQIGPSFVDWQSVQRGRRWFRAGDGRHVVIDSTRAIDAPGAMRALDGAISDASRTVLANEVFNGGPPPPIVLDGIASGASVADLCRRFERLPNRAWARIYALESDPLRVFDALATGVLDDRLSEDRLRFFVGPGCHDLLIEHLARSNDQWSTLSYLPGAPQGTPGARNTPASFQERLLSLERARLDEYRALCAKNNATYARRDAAWWRDRYRGALAGTQPPLRVLVPTTRYSTYVQHASRDIVSALNSQGFEARLLIEHDDSSLREGLMMARAVHEFQPDAVLVTNYTRATFGDSVPRQTPHVCWIQDELSHLFTDDLRRDVDERTILVGNVYTSLVTKHHVPIDRCLIMGVPASASKFNAPINDRPTCDLFIATNHGQTPADLRDRLLEDCLQAGGPRDLIPDMHAQIEQHLSSWRCGVLEPWLIELLEPVFRHHRVAPDGPNRGALLREAAVPMVNRMLRHRLMGWAADLAESESITLRVAGRGWEDHPRLARFSVPEIPHGPTLRDEYHNARLTLQTSAASLLHQRVHESLLAGSMPALMLTPDALTAILRPARVATAHARPTCSTINDRLLRLRAWDDPIIALSLGTAQRVMPDAWASEADAHACSDEPEARALREGIIPWRTGHPGAYAKIDESVPYIEQARFIDAISPGMFWDRDELLALVRRAQEHPEWRAAQIRHARGITRRWFTYEHATGQILSAMSDQLTRALAE